MSQLCTYCQKPTVAAGQCTLCGKVSAPRRFSGALPTGIILNAQYRVEDVLGSPGGFGIAYLAYDQSLQRHVVIKELFPSHQVSRQDGQTQVEVLRSDLMSEFYCLRDSFLDEARKLAQLESVDSVVRVISFFLENNTAYFVMPWISGQSLADRIKYGGTVDANTLMKWIFLLAEGLQEVHRAGIIHKDIKPENILLDERGRPILIDFGNAAAINNREETTPQQFAVSPHFGAPEQYANDASRIGPWTDIYALGALMYFCLTGFRPVDAKNRMVRQELPSIHSLAPNTPEALIRVIDHCLALKQQERLQDLEGFLQSVTQFRPAFHWLDALGSSKLALSLRQSHLQVERGSSYPKRFNLRAGIFQWVWFFTLKLNVLGALIGAIHLGVFLLALSISASMIIAGAAFLVSWLVCFFPCAWYADGLLFKRLSLLASSLKLSSESQKELLRARITKEALPDSVGLAIAFSLPFLMTLSVFKMMSDHDDIKTRINAAILEVKNVQGQEIVEYQMAEPNVPPSDDVMKTKRHPDTVLAEVRVNAGNIDMRLALDGVENRRLSWVQRPVASGNWVCVAVDIEPHFTPDICLP